MIGKRRHGHGKHAGSALATGECDRVNPESQGTGRGGDASAHIVDRSRSLAEWRDDPELAAGIEHSGRP
jgi:hypothetical protein